MIIVITTMDAQANAGPFYHFIKDWIQVPISTRRYRP